MDFSTSAHAAAYRRQTAFQAAQARHAAGPSSRAMARARRELAKTKGKKYLQASSAEQKSDLTVPLGNGSDSNASALASS